MIRLSRVRYIAPGHGEVRYVSPSCEVPLPLRRCQAGISKGGEATAQGTSSALVSGAKKHSVSAAQPGGSQGGFPRFQLRGSPEGMGGLSRATILESGRGGLSRGQRVAPQETVDVDGKDRAVLGVDGL